MAQIPCTREHVLLRSQPSTRDCIPIANNPVSHYPKNQCPVPGLSPHSHPGHFTQGAITQQPNRFSRHKTLYVPNRKYRPARNAKKSFFGGKAATFVFSFIVIISHDLYKPASHFTSFSPPPVTQTSHTSHKSIWQSCTAPRYKSACMYGWQKAVYSFLQRFVMTHSVFHCSGPLRMRMRMRIRIRMQMQRRNRDEVSYP